jgi:hypothetical protein
MAKNTSPSLPESSDPEATLYANFKATTLALRDAELAFLAARARHQEAQQALYACIAPVPQSA